MLVACGGRISLLIGFYVDHAEHGGERENAKAQQLQK
jgi:hypothetical protein